MPYIACDLAVQDLHDMTVLVMKKINDAFYLDKELLWPERFKPVHEIRVIQQGYPQSIIEDERGCLHTVNSQDLQFNFDAVYRQVEDFYRERERPNTNVLLLLTE